VKSYSLRTPQANSPQYGDALYDFMSRSPAPTRPAFYHKPEEDALGPAALSWDYLRSEAAGLILHFSGSIGKTGYQRPQAIMNDLPYTGVKAHSSFEKRKRAKDVPR
jgi:hypothetical protein